MEYKDNELFAFVDAQSRPVLVIGSGRVAHGNRAAETFLLGEFPQRALTGLDAGEFLTEELMAPGDGSVNGEVTINGERVAVTASTLGGYTLATFHTSCQHDEAFRNTVTNILARYNRDVASVSLTADVLCERARVTDDQASQDVCSALQKAAACLRRTGRNMELAFVPPKTIDAAGFDFYSLVKDTYLSTRYLLNNREDINFTYDYDGVTSPYYGDRWLMEIAMICAISNAIKYSPKNGTVSIWGETTDREVIAVIHDDGPGIQAQGRDELYHFYDRTPTLLDPKEGIGLGLAVMENILRLHDGYSEIKSEPGKGTDVVLHFPIKEKFTAQVYHSPLLVRDREYENYIMELADEMVLATFTDAAER